MAITTSPTAPNSPISPIHKATNLSPISSASSVDGLAKDHDLRRKPATYEKILRYIADARVNTHWTVVNQHMQQPGYLEEYVSFWNARPEVNKLWMSVYTPQRREFSPEILPPRPPHQPRRPNPRPLPKLRVPDGMAKAFLAPPSSPEDSIFSRMSANYTADFKTPVEPCVFGGDPDCAQCGCSHVSRTPLDWRR